MTPVASRKKTLRYSLGLLAKSGRFLLRRAVVIFELLWIIPQENSGGIAFLSTIVPFSRTPSFFPSLALANTGQYLLSFCMRYPSSCGIARVSGGECKKAILTIRVIIEAFLAVVERILPEQFLAKVTGQRIVAKHSGSFF